MATTTAVMSSSIARERLRVLGAGVLAIILSVGVARFAYTPLLPLMQHQAGLSIGAGGWLASINYAGYLIGALAASRIHSLHLKDRLYRIGMVLAVLSTALMPLSTSPTVWAISRFIAGLTSAAGMLLAAGLVLNWLMRHNLRSELGIQFAGIGLGIAGCAALVGLLDPALDWRGQWWTFSGLALLLLWPALAWMPRPEPLGSPVRADAPDMTAHPPSQTYLRVFMASYFCAGVAYVIGTTFIVDIVNKLPGLAGQGNLAFLAIGLGAAPACIAWDLIARRIGDTPSLILAATLQIAGVLMPLWPGGAIATLAGAALFGATFVGMVSLVLTIAGRYYPGSPARMMGRMTLSYGVAQIIAPALTAALAVSSGSYEAGLWLSAAALVVGILLLGVLRGMELRARTL